ncbi:protein kinase family protein [Candidatus Woesearchaeota archaeon]|nr:protein kinase family protein [Candidatus Woesearchaeota archaeon]
MASLEQLAGDRKKRLKNEVLDFLVDQEIRMVDEGIQKITDPKEIDERKSWRATLVELKEGTGVYGGMFEGEPNRNGMILSRYGMINRQRLDAILDYGAVKSGGEAVECCKTEYNDYDILARLGDGAAKIAYLARNKHSGDIRVLLMMQPTENWKRYHQKVKPGLSDDELVQRIFQVEFSGAKLQHIRHPNVLAFSPPKRGKDQYGKDAYFFETLPYEKRLDIRFQEGPVDTNKGLKYLLDIVRGLSECHKQGVVHKDLSPKNIGIMSDDDCVLTDFGCLSLFSSGRPQYFYPRRLMPPELAKPTEQLMKERGVGWPSDLFTPEANIWTVGAMAYWMFTGRDLFHVDEKRAKANTKDYDRQNGLLDSMIQAFPSRREAVLAELEQIHPYARAIAGLCLQMEPEKRTGALERIVDLLDGSTKLAGGGLVKFDTRDGGDIIERSFSYRPAVRFRRYRDLSNRFVNWQYPEIVSPRPRYMHSMDHEDREMLLRDAIQGLMEDLRSYGERDIGVVYVMPAEHRPPTVQPHLLTVHIQVEQDGFPLTYHRQNKTFYLDFFDPRFLEFQAKVEEDSIDSSSFRLVIIDRKCRNDVINVWPTNFGMDKEPPTFAPRLFV